MDEKSILKKLRNRDEKAFEEIIDLYSAYITAVVRNLLGSRGTKEDVEEVVADTFIALWNTAERINYEEYSSIKAYIAVIARNKAKDWLRAAKGQNLQLLDDILIIDNSVGTDNCPERTTENHSKNFKTVKTVGLEDFCGLLLPVRKSV